MKAIFALLFVSILAASGCAGAKENKPMIDDLQLVELKHAQVSNFLKALPFILDYSKKYRDNLPLSEMESPEFNKKFFDTLNQSVKFKDAALAAGFTNPLDCTLVYRNVILAFVELKSEFTNNVTNQVSELREKIAQVGVSINDELKQKGVAADKRRYLEEQKTELVTHSLLLSNIMTVSAFEKILDAAQGNTTN